MRHIPRDVPEMHTVRNAAKPYMDFVILNLPQDFQLEHPRVALTLCSTCLLPWDIKPWRLQLEQNGGDKRGVRKRRIVHDRAPKGWNLAQLIAGV
jgi:hypothetical protein